MRPFLKRESWPTPLSRGAPFLSQAKAEQGERKPAGARNSLLGILLSPELPVHAASQSRAGAVPTEPLPLTHPSTLLQGTASRGAFKRCRPPLPIPPQLGPCSIQGCLVMLPGDVHVHVSPESDFWKALKGSSCELGSKCSPFFLGTIGRTVFITDLALPPRRDEVNLLSCFLGEVGNTGNNK